MIHFRNTRTGRTVAAKDGKDVALMLKIEQDRRSGIEASQQGQAAFASLYRGAQKQGLVK